MSDHAREHLKEALAERYSVEEEIGRGGNQGGGSPTGRPGRMPSARWRLLEGVRDAGDPPSFRRPEQREDVHPAV